MIGNLPLKCLMMSMDKPASRGVHGPGETRMRSGLSASICSIVTSSFRCTSTSAFNSPKYWTRLKVNES